MTWGRVGSRWSMLGALVALAAGCAEPPPWTDAYDFDGDGRNDHVEARHSGGAHCCYTLTVQLSASGRRQALPFQLDGGYVGGLDLSKPQQFSIRAAPGAAPELLMQIETYNGVPQPLPPEWLRQYGIRSHRIGVSFPGGRMVVRDIAAD